MQVSQAAAIWLEYHKSHSRPNTLKAYRVVLSRFCQEFGDRSVNWKNNCSALINRDMALFNSLVHAEKATFAADDVLWT